MQPDRHRFRSRRLVCPREHHRVRHHAQQNKDHEGHDRARTDRGNTGNCAGLTSRRPETISCGTAPTTTLRPQPEAAFSTKRGTLEAVIEDAAQRQRCFRRFRSCERPSVECRGSCRTGGRRRPTAGEGLTGLRCGGGARRRRARRRPGPRRPRCRAARLRRARSPEAARSGPGGGSSASSSCSSCGRSLQGGRRVRVAIGEEEEVRVRLAGVAEGTRPRGCGSPPACGR